MDNVLQICLFLLFLHLIYQSYKKIKKNMLTLNSACYSFRYIFWKFQLGKKP